MSSSATHGSTAHDLSASTAMVAAADLGCGLCRKRTGEPVTKLCHACGLPLHISCAQHVAGRECELEFGFPLPTVFCSKRCYDGDFLGANDDEGVDGQNGGKRWSPQVPNEVTAALTLKIGDVSRTSRKHLSITTFRFLLSEGFDVFKAKVNSRTIKELQTHASDPHVREDTAIYIRPGVHSKQAELVELTEKNFETRIRKTFRNFLKRKATQTAAAAGVAALRQEQFECDIYTYVKKTSAVRRRNNTSSTLAVGDADAVGLQAVGRPGSVKILNGLAVQHDLMQQHRLRGDYADSAGGATSEGQDSFDGSVVGSTTVGAKRRLSEMQTRDGVLGAGIDQGSDAATPGYKSIRMILNGSVVSVKVNVADLVAALGAQPSVLQAAFGDSDAASVSVNGDAMHC